MLSFVPPPAAGAVAQSNRQFASRSPVATSDMIRRGGLCRLSGRGVLRAARSRRFPQAFHHPSESSREDSPNTFGTLTGMAREVPHPCGRPQD